MEAVRHIDFASRVSARAIFAGLVVALASLALLLMLVAALGLGSFTVASLRSPSPGYFLGSTIAWIVSAFLGGWIAAIAARATLLRDALLHGLVTWAATMLAWIVLAVSVLLGAVGSGLVSAESVRQVVHASPGRYFAEFVASGLALCASLLGGSAGAQVEAKAGREKVRPGERVPIVPTPQPT